jgi:hypothetical protein
MFLRFPSLLLVTLATAGAATAAPTATKADDAIEQVRRLYDLTPISADNPVIASVRECGIAIPLSEFRAYVRTDTPPDRVGQTLTTEEKRREVQKLIDEHFWVWSGYAHHIDETDPDIKSMLRITRNEALRSLLIKQEVEDKAKSMAEFQLLRKAFIRRLFDQLNVHVSPPAFALAKAAAKRLNAADATGKPRDPDDTTLPDGLTQEQRLQPLATCQIGTLRIGDFLAVYSNPPVAVRVDLDQPDNVAPLLAEAFSGTLLLAEAEARGLDRTAAVREQIQSDRTGLVRQWAIEEIAKKADTMAHDPANEPQLKAWYDAHRATLYTSKDEHGQTHVLPYTPNSDRIQSDYFTHLFEQLRHAELQRLRQGKTIVVDERRLADATVRWLEPPTRVEMPASKISWNGDTREYVVKPGETKTSFVFTLRNVSADLLTIDDIHPINEFVTVDGPPLPWRLKPGMSADVKLDVDLRDKIGVGTASIEVTSSVGSKTLTLRITYPPRPVAGPATGAQPEKSM